MSSPPNGSSVNLPLPITIVLLALAYFVTGWLGLEWAIHSGFATPVWPPSGIALAVLLLFGKRAWPGIFLGSFLVNLASDQSFGSILSASPAALGNAAGIAAGAALQAIGGAWLLQRFGGFPNALTTLSQIIRFFLIAGPISCLINAAIGPTTLLAGGFIGPDSWLATAIAWWAGDTLGAVIFTPIILVWGFGPRDRWASRRIPVTASLLIAFTVSVASYHLIRTADRESVVAELRNTAERLARSLTRTLDSHIAILNVQEGLFRAFGTVRQEQFRQVTEKALENLPALHAISWNPRFPDRQRYAMEETLRRFHGPETRITERDADGKIVPAARRAEYVIVEMVEPLKPNIPALGFDVLSNPARRAALDAARDSGEIVATGRIDLVQATGTTEPRAGFLVFRPHYRTGAPLGTVEERRQALTGYHTAVFLVDELIGPALERAFPSEVSVALTDQEASGSSRILFSTGSDASGQIAERWVHGISLPGRQWQLSVDVPLFYLNTLLERSGWSVFLPCLCISVLLGGITLIGTGRQVELEESVRLRTAQLNEEIAERISAQGDLIVARDQAEAASRAKSEFLSSVSHELRTPLNGVLGFGRMLKMQVDGPLNAAQENAVNLVIKGGEHLLRLIEQILDLSNIAQNQVTLTIDDVSPQTIINDCLTLTSPLAVDRGLRTEVGGLARPGATVPVPLVRADATRLRQVLLNFLTNAIKYNTTGSRVSLTCDTARPGFLRFTVSDDGPGIPPEKMDAVFTPFDRLGMEASTIDGTGIGLAISKELIERMGGEIGFTSREKETVFWFELPLSRSADRSVPEARRGATPEQALAAAVAPAEPEPMPEAGAAAKGEPGPGRKTGLASQQSKVLYIEDNRVNRLLMAQIVRLAENVDMLEADTAEAGIEMARRDRPDLILLDINLPGMSGLEAIGILRDAPEIPGIPIIAVSAAAMPEDRQRIEEAGFDEFIEKPYQPARILELLKQRLGADARPAA